MQVAIPRTLPSTRQSPRVPKGTLGRTFRRVLDQQEGVVLASNHAGVNRTALRFGSRGCLETSTAEAEDFFSVVRGCSEAPRPLLFVSVLHVVHITLRGKALWHTHLVWNIVAIFNTTLY